MTEGGGVRRSDRPGGGDGGGAPGGRGPPLPVLALGTLTLDTVETPEGSRQDAPGGSALYFAAAAGLLAPVRLMGVVGEDYPARARAALERTGADLAGLARIPGSTMRWRARYRAGGTDRTTLAADRGVLGRWRPRIPDGWRGTPVLVLGSTAPELQAAVLDQVEGPALVVADSMEHWIRDRRRTLERVLARTDLFLGSEDECRALGRGAGTRAAAADAIRALGPPRVVVKRGKRGATLFGEGNGGTRELAEVPAWPVKRVVDPTGAGDAFAGGLVGWLAREGAAEPGPPTLVRALSAGAAAASFAVEGFSTDRMTGVTLHELRSRVERVTGETRR